VRIGSTKVEFLKYSPVSPVPAITVALTNI
jgi:hypothetical protein